MYYIGFVDIKQHASFIEDLPIMHKASYITVVREGLYFIEVDES